MEEAKLTYPQWQAPLQDAILEFNPDKLPAKIYRVETLIFQRIQQLKSNNDDAGECQAINNALEVLRSLKRERLQSPDWK